MRLVVAIALSVGRLVAQHEPDTFGHSRHGATFDEGPRRAAHRMVGLGDQVHFPVAGIGAEAQAFFDQGITQQHGFWYFEAERSFRQVALLHPDCAMAYWGMSLANVENPARAAGFIASAVQRAAQAPARERAWIDAWASYYQLDAAARTELQSGDAERAAKATAETVAKNQDRQQELKQRLDKQLIKDLGTIVYEHPDDLEAKALLAVQIWRAYEWGNGVPIVSHTAVDALLGDVFAQAPLHPAHHYRIHLWDQEDARRALPSAAHNGASAPAIAHQWHMAGHIYAKLHRHAEAAWQQEASSRADHAYMQRDAVMPFLIHNYGHNQEWLARSLSHCGRYDEALAIAQNLAELPRHPKWNRIDKTSDIAGYARARLAQICEDHGLWQQAVALCEAGYLEASDDVNSEAQRLSLLGRALFRTGHADEAAHVVADADALLVRARAQRAAAIDTAEDRAHADKGTRDAMAAAAVEAARRPTDAVQAVLDLRRELRGEQLLAAGDAKAALAEFDKVPGMPLVLLADARVAAGELDRAIQDLEAENQKNPNRAATMAALLAAYVAKGDDAKSKLHELMVATAAATAPSFWAHCGLGVDVCTRALAGRTPGETAAFGADFGDRPPLASLGPKLWAPVANPGCVLPAIDGTTFRLAAAGRQRATLVVFYLGFGCLHCVEQLHALRPAAAAFAAIGVDVVAIGTDTLAKTREAHDALAPTERMPFAMLADPELGAFKAWHCYDDFERMPLHGTFLVDADGRVRWQDISYEPFTAIDWLLVETRRLLRLPAAGGASASGGGH